MFTTFDKALVPPVVMLVLAVLGQFGLTGEMALGDIVTLLVTGGLVWLVPNTKKD